MKLSLRIVPYILTYVSTFRLNPTFDPQNSSSCVVGVAYWSSIEFEKTEINFKENAD